jgi:hypothetical protein
MNEMKEGVATSCKVEGGERVGEEVSDLDEEEV